MSNRAVFEQLNTTDLSKLIKTNQNQRYLPWNTAWAELCKQHPTATYEFHCDANGVPCFENGNCDLFVKVSVTVDGLTHTMIRPVYNNAMKSMKSVSYKYQTKSGEKTVAAANGDDINDALMRCLTKAIAMHGLGLYIYQDKQYADAMLITSDQMTEITKAVSSSGVMLGELNKAFGINKLTELYECNFEAALKWVEDNSKTNKG